MGSMIQKNHLIYFNPLFSDKTFSNTIGSIIQKNQKHLRILSVA